MKIYIKRFDFASVEDFNEMVCWCKKTFYHGGYYEPSWWHDYHTFYFGDEKEYMLFLLRWA